jgi:hypothetical protein
MNLTKTDFIQYLNCPKSLWLLKNKPEEYPKGEFSLFLEKLIKDGYEVEEYAKQLFPGGVELPEYGGEIETKTALEGDKKYFFQPSFETERGLFARVDILEKNEDGTVHIYEVKSSTEVKRDKKHDHVKDACFQKYALEKMGYKVDGVSLIHLNKEYVREGDIDPIKLLKTVDITELVGTVFDEVSDHIEAALELLDKKEIGEVACDCREKTRSNHCDAFQYFNKDLPDNPIYNIGRISRKKIMKLVDEGLVDIVDVGSEYEMNEKQELQIRSTQLQKPIIDYDAISEQLDELKFPLHFIDYETYASAVPRIDGMRPHRHVPFQVSIHTMHKNGEVEHFEYLAEKLELPDKLVKFMQDSTGTTGTFISWRASFEIGRNREMIVMYPQHTDYLKYQNEHMFDLEKIFMMDYVDYRFKGSTSIKNVLPVLLPELSYKDLDVQNGTMALDLWGRMVLDSEFSEDKELTRKNLLDYCKLDTWAMVEIYRVLNNL